MQRYTPSTEVLEYIHPGSTSRGDFHSDSTAHNALDTFSSGPLNDYVAIPSRGLAGPFNYRPLPPRTQAVLPLNPTGAFHGNLPKGKRNPKKKSSDDARIAPCMDMDPRQASNGADPRRTFAPEAMQIQFYPQTPGTIPIVQETGSSSRAVPYPSNFRHPKLPPGQGSANGQERSDHHPCHRQVPLQATMEVRSGDRAVSNPFAPSAPGLQRSTQDPCFTAPSLPIPTQVPNQMFTASEQLFEESAGLVSPQEQSHDAQPLDTRAFEHQLDVQHQMDQFPKSQRPALAPMSNSGQSQFPGSSARSSGNDNRRQSVQEGCTIWIGSIPKNLNKAGLMDLLRPCRGLLEVSGPRTKYYSPRSYAFAEYVFSFGQIHIILIRGCRFRDPADAAEALERLPQLRLPEGDFLQANYPRPKKYASPGQFQHASGGDSKRPVFNVSPKKSCGGGNSNRAGKSNQEHSRKPSRDSSRWRETSIGGFEGKPGQRHERESAMDADQQESDLKPEEAIASPDRNGNVGSTAPVSQSSTASTGSPDPTLASQDLGALRLVSVVEPQATQVSKAIGDGGRDISSAPSVSVQVQESHQATSPKRTEGRTKSSKKKSKGLKKLPSPESKGSVLPEVHTALGNANPEARAMPSIHDAIEVPEDASHMGESGNQAALEIEASKTVASAVPWEPTSAVLKDLETADQSFLGCNLPEAGGEQPKTSVVNIIKAGVSKDDKTEVLETAHAPVDAALSTVVLKETKEQTAQAMRRDESSSTQGSADTDSSILSYTGPPSTSQTERSNSIAHEILSPLVQAACPPSGTTLSPLSVEPGELRRRLEDSILTASVSQSGTPITSERALEEYGASQQVRPDGETPCRVAESGKTAMEQRLEVSMSLAPSDVGKGMMSARKELQSITKAEFGGLQPGLTGTNHKQIASILTTQPTGSKSDRDSLESPVRNRALSIPPRSSSLVTPSTPIKTHQKKKPRNLAPVKEASPSKVKGLSVEGTKMDSCLQTTGSTKPNFPILTIDPTVRTLKTDKPRDLPEPETPFLMDDGMRVTPPKISHQSVDALNADRYYAQKCDYQVFHWSNASQISPTSCSLDSHDSASTHLSETSTPDRASAKKETDVETTLREAGFRSLSGTGPFTIRDAELAWLETIDEEGRPLENRNNNKEGPVLTWLDEKGKITSIIDFDAWNKQNEMIDVVKKATAVKRLLAGSPPLPWTKIKSFRQQLSRFIAHSPSNAEEQQTTKPKAHQIRKAEALLNTVPQRDSSISEIQKWSTRVSLFVEENVSEPSLASAESRKSTNNNPSKASRGTPSRRQQQERRHPILINQSDTQIPIRKAGKDEAASPTANTELDRSLLSPQTTESEQSSSTCGRPTPSDEDSTSSEIPTQSAALDQPTNLKDLFVEIEDRRRCSDDRQPLSTSREEERMIVPDPELETLGEELDACRISGVENLEPEQGIKEKGNTVQQKCSTEKPHESRWTEIGNDGGNQDRELTVNSDNSKDSASVVPKKKASLKPEEPKHRKPTSQLLGLSFSSFDSNRTTSNEGSTDEAQLVRPRGGHSPLKRSGYNAVAGRGIERKRSDGKEAGKDPWALPQGEMAWGSGCERRGGRKRRGVH